MLRSTLCTTLCIALAAAPMTATARSREAVTRMCRDAVVARGYSGYGFEREEYTVARSGGTSLTGQIVRGGNRLEFNCVVDGGRIRDVVFNRLSGAKRPGKAASRR